MYNVKTKESIGPSTELRAKFCVGASFSIYMNKFESVRHVIQITAWEFFEYQWCILISVVKYRGQQ